MRPARTVSGQPRPAAAMCLSTPGLRQVCLSLVPRAPACQCSSLSPADGIQTTSHFQPGPPAETPSFVLGKVAGAGQGRGKELASIRPRAGSRGHGGPRTLASPKSYSSNGGAKWDGTTRIRR